MEPARAANNNGSSLKWLISAWTNGPKKRLQIFCVLLYNEVSGKRMQ